MAERVFFRQYAPFLQMGERARARLRTRHFDEGGISMKALRATWSIISMNAYTPPPRLLCTNLRVKLGDHWQMAGRAQMANRSVMLPRSASSLRPRIATLSSHSGPFSCTVPIGDDLDAFREIPPLRRLGETINSVIATSLDSVDPGCQLGRPSTDSQARYRRETTKLFRASLTHSNPIHRGGAVARLQRVRGGRDWIKGIRVCLLGQLSREIIALFHFHPITREIFLLGLRVPENGDPNTCAPNAKRRAAHR